MTPPLSSLKSHVSSLLLVLLFAALAAATHLLANGGRFWTGWDDAFITYRFASNAAHGHWFVWNIAEPPVYGFTNFSYFLLLVPFAALNLNLAAVSLVLGFLFHGLAAYLAGCLVRRAGSVFATRPESGPDLPAIFCSLILACNYHLGWATTSGPNTARSPTSGPKPSPTSPDLPPFTGG
jgi:hypothetical protein